MRDFAMYVASDCVAAPVEQHQASLNIMSAAFATVLPWREAIADITGAPAPAPAPAAPAAV